ncbi:unnamed protein product [Cuscuta campestris]|uniref:Uncharacterized protein n=1 Tax=Cuscuta campestris TaxID=132261 RepID=A0A484M902_9ASTE|nr:unnamed protein product [Cuscuta campestris]
MVEQGNKMNLTSALWEHYSSESITGQGKSDIAKGVDKCNDDSNEPTMCKKLASLSLANINEVKDPSAETKPPGADSVHSILQNSSGIMYQEYLRQLIESHISTLNRSLQLSNTLDVLRARVSVWYQYD